MSKILLALRKARDEKNWDSPFNGQMTDLLTGEPVPTNHERRTVRRSRRKRRVEAADGHSTRLALSSVDERLVALHNANAPVSEQYRKLFIEIVRAGHVRELRTLLISSALAEEGKTTTALNLAITMTAGGEQEVLLVETDFRNPSIHKMLGVRPACGLTDYLLGDVAYDQPFTKTQIPGLTVVHAGRSVENLTALLGSAKLEQFFQRVKSQHHYTYIILDSSPILLTFEPSALVQYADTAILVVHAQKTPRDVVSKAIEVLGVENILGCVFNGLTASDSYYYRYYYRSDYYHTNSGSQH
jgi:capsular exopolysaccharide synthesis family protein